MVVGIFSPACAEQEAKVAEIVRKAYPDMSITLSHEVGLIGLIERENASILNESLKPLCQKTVTAFRSALHSLGLKCPFYMTQNDGTIIRYIYTHRQMSVTKYASAVFFLCEGWHVRNALLSGL